MKVAYLGPKGSFTHSACLSHYPKEELLPFPTIPSCLKAVEQGAVSVCVVPIENTIEGTVNLTLDFLFHKTNLQVVGELVMPIAQQLLVDSQHIKELGMINYLYSHPQALAQCQEFITEYLPTAQIMATDSTSLAAKLVAEEKYVDSAAIGPIACGEEYGLTVIKQDIQDISHNKTRFWLVSKEALTCSHNPITKASLCLTMPNNLPGALQKALTTFSWREINLSKIESRPLKTMLGDYFFLVDLVLKESQWDLYQNALAEIKSLGGEVKEFGCYQVSQIAGL